MKNNFNYVVIVFILIILIVGGYRYYQYINEKNFILEVNTICDSQTESCFDASEDLSFGQNPYEKVSILAKYAPKCLEEHTCDSFSCSAGLTANQCEVTYCSDDTKVDGEECTGLNNK
jgi:hypothetical protein